MYILLILTFWFYLISNIPVTLNYKCFSYEIPHDRINNLKSGFLLNIIEQ